MCSECGDPLAVRAEGHTQRTIAYHVEVTQERGGVKEGSPSLQTRGAQKPAVAAEDDVGHGKGRSYFGLLELQGGYIPYQDAVRAGAVIPRRQKPAIRAKRQASQ